MHIRPQHPHTLNHPQLECGGIIEALRILKCGYPTRCTYDDIFDRYGSILNPTPPDLNKRDFCEAILRNAGETLERSEFQLGLTKVAKLEHPKHNCVCTAYPSTPPHHSMTP